MSDFDFEVLKLEPGEGVMRQTNDIWSFDGENEHGFDYLFLTNKNIILLSESSKLFGKGKTIVRKISFFQIINVAQVDDEEYGNGLRIYYKDGKTELYTLNAVSEKDYHIWVKAINDTICSISGVSTEAQPPVLPPLTNKDTFEDINESSDKPFSAPSAADSQKPPQPQPQPTQQKPTNSREPKKCPHCGEIVDSFVAICPACGHEINNANTPTVVEQFISDVTACEKIIATNTQNQTGWASWSKNKRIGWVILNILFTGIPLAVYLVLPLIFIKLTPKLTTEEKQLASLVENFNFPNDRESILAALIFTKEKIDFISKEKIDRKSAYWMRLWCAKAEQLKQKADILFPNDEIVKKTYAEINVDDEKVKKTIKMKAIFGIVLSVIIIAFSFIRFGPTNDTSTADGKDYSATFDWQTNGLFAELPEPNSNNGRIVRESADQIHFEIYNVSSADFDAYVKSCRETGFTVDLTKTDSVFYAHNEEGYDLSIHYRDDESVMKVYVNSYDIGKPTETTMEKQTETITEELTNIESTTNNKIQIEYTINYNNAEAFEKALNNGENVKGNIVEFSLKKYEPDSAFGYNCQAGEHLNFISKDDVDVKEGSVIIGKITEEPYEFLGCWIIACEVLEIDN